MHPSRLKVARAKDGSCAEHVCMRLCCEPSEDYAVHSPSAVAIHWQVERNNGRAAMMGITGMMVHNALGVDSLFPIVQ